MRIGHGYDVHRLVPEPHLPYMVYTRDSVVVTHAGPVLCQLERPQRRGEECRLPVCKFVEQDEYDLFFHRAPIFSDFCQRW